MTILIRRHQETDRTFSKSGFFFSLKETTSSRSKRKGKLRKRGGGAEWGCKESRSYPWEDSARVRAGEAQRTGSAGLCFLDDGQARGKGGRSWGAVSPFSTESGHLPSSLLPSAGHITGVRGPQTAPPPQMLLH